MSARMVPKVIFTMTAAFLAALALTWLSSVGPALGNEPVTAIIYVDADASVGGDGQSWSSAYRYLQDALDETNAHGGNSYEIWVAEGVYAPDEDADGDHVPDAATETFRIAYDNVRLYGGFAGGETARDQRDWRANTTVLSGDVDDNDVAGAGSVVMDAAHIQSNNAYHVLWLDGETHEPITGATVIDGFTITAGLADGGGRDDKGGGVYLAGSGGADEEAGCSPTLSNISFSGNSAHCCGGAMYNDGADGGASSPTLTNVTYSGNSALWGGAIYDDGFLGTSSPTLTNVTLSHNSAHCGGAIYSDGWGGISAPTLANTILWGNTASGCSDQMFNLYATPAIGHSLVEGGWDGSGIHNDHSTVIDNGGNIDADPQFVDAGDDNLRLKGNSPAIDAGDNTAVASSVTTDLDGNPRFVDVVTVGDTGSGTPPIVDMGAYEARAAPYLIIRKSVTPDSASALQGTITYTVALDNVGAVTDTQVLLTDTLPASVSFGGWIEQPSAALLDDDVITWTGAVEAGEAITLTYSAGYICQHCGQAVTNTAEFSGTLQAGRGHAAFTVEPPVLYVDRDATGAATGSSWTDAYPNLQDALDRSNAHAGKGYEIWVAAGVYTPDQDADGDHRDNDEQESFTLSHNNVRLYGGFAGGETAREQRNWEENVTVLSGDIDGNDITDAHGVVTATTGIRGSNAYHVLWLDGETHEPITGVTLIDGFTITAGQAYGSWPHDEGGGMYCAGNGGHHLGDHAECSPTLANIVFSGNSAERFGGAMLNDGGDGGTSNPTLTDVTFSSNSAQHGGAMHNDGDGGTSSPVLSDVVFNANSASSGGGMYNDGHYGNSSPTLTNVVFSHNSASWGGAMTNDGRHGNSSPTLTNVVFSRNSAEDDGGAMYNDGFFGASSPTLTNVTFNGNSARYDGGAMVNHGLDGDSTPTLTNVILWGNSAGGEGNQMVNEYAAPAIGQSLVEGGWEGDGIVNHYGTVTNNGGNIDADPLFVDADGGNLRLRGSSPATDAGDNSAVPAAVTSDVDGNTRFVDIPAVSDTGIGTPPIVDMGAHEVQAAPYLTISKSVAPGSGVVLHGIITYTIVLDNVGVVSDTRALLTDTLPAGVSFGAWIEQPAGAVLEDDVITWTGSVEAGASSRLIFSAHYTCDVCGQVLTNDAQFSGTLQAGQAQASFLVEPAVLYVKPDATGSARGITWTDAFTNVQDALDRTNAHGSHMYEIWVAQGVYTPDEDGDGDHVRDAVTETFRISYNNVRLYGGFIGGETERDQRDWEANATVLSGDVDVNDPTDAKGVVSDAGDIEGSNAYHVLWLDGETYEPITGSTIIDGFTITAGQAHGAWPDDDGGGIYCAGHGSGAVGEHTECSPALSNVTFSGNSADSDGGAMLNDGRHGNSSPTLTNVTFSGNSASRGGAMYSYGRYLNSTSSPMLTNVVFSQNSAQSGGAMYSNGQEGGTSSPTLTNVTFSDNSAGMNGGAMYNNGEDGGASSPELISVTFSGNTAGVNGGAIYNDGYIGMSSPALANVVFSGNSADSGGAMYNDGQDGGTSSPTLTNVTFSGNSAGSGGAIYSYGHWGASSPTLTNVILWGNTASGDGDQMANLHASPAIGYSLVEGGWDGPGIYNDDGAVTDNGANIDADPRFVDAEGANLRLGCNSPAIDAGDNTAVPSGIATDLDGNPRFVDVHSVGDTGRGAPPIVDMGAYEVQNCVYLPLLFM